MTDARIVVEPATLRPRQPGPATGVIWLSLGEVAFPAPGWDDFVIVILDWWANAVLQLLRGTSKSEVVHFMDGPFQAKLVVRSSTEWDISAFDTRSKTPLTESTVDPRPLVESILTASQALLDACRAKSYTAPATDALTELESSLRAEVLRAMPELMRS